MKRSLYDHLILSAKDMKQYDREFEESPEIKKKNSIKNTLKCRPIPILHLHKKGLNSYLVSAYVTTLKRSTLYRSCSMKTLIQYFNEKVSQAEEIIILIRLRNPRKHFLDYSWSEKMSRMALERREIDHAMSWLSTLGGAYSALGEKISHCALVAGKISVQQFKLAYRLGDPLLVARCKLYASLSLMQRGNLKEPKYMIKDIYKFSLREKDFRLQNMCQGLWAKLKYYASTRNKQLGTF